MYIAVLEYLASSGGYAGVRVWTPYESEAEFNRLYPADFSDKTKVVAKNVSEKNAQNITSLTPEISRIAAAIEESYIKETDSIDLDSLKFNLLAAYNIIQEDRQTIKKKHLKRITTFEKCVVGQEDNEKSRLLRIVLSLSMNQYGQVNIHYINEFVAYEVKSILVQRLIKSVSDGSFFQTKP